MEHRVAYGASHGHLSSFLTVSRNVHSHKAYNLAPLPPKHDLSTARFAEDLLEARVALAELKGYGELLPNPMLLLSPAVLRESIASSEIEDIHTTILEALQMQLFPEAERRQSDKEVLRYRDALLGAFDLLPQLPVCTRMIHKIHQRLLPSGEEGYRGQQNQIINSATGEIVYTPPPVPEIEALISNFEGFLNRADDRIDPLIKAAVSHYQFEAIHPFSDGNGRCGRILIVLYLVQAGLLRWPILFISGYLIRKRSEYYRLLRNVTQNHDWDSFIRFMLAGFREQAIATRELLLSTMALLENFKARVREKLPNVYSHEMVEALFSTPVITPSHLSLLTKVHYRTAGRQLTQFLEAGFLKDRHHGKYHLFFNTELIELLQREKPASPGGPEELETISLPA